MAGILSVSATASSGTFPPSEAERMKSPRWKLRRVMMPSNGALILV